MRQYHGPGGTLPIDEDTQSEVVRLTLDEEKPPKEIAGICGISIPSVLRILSKHGIAYVSVRQRKERAKRNSTPLTKEQFYGIHACKMAGRTSGDCAKEAQADLYETNAAWPMRDYERYLEVR